MSAKNFRRLETARDSVEELPDINRGRNTHRNVLSDSIFLFGGKKLQYITV